jgi:phage-related protein
MRTWIAFMTGVALMGQSGEVKLVGAAKRRGEVIRLTPAAEFERGAAWRTDRVVVRDGFNTSFRFRITEAGGLGEGADGFAFVIQNNGPAAIAGRGASGGFGFGDGRGDRKQAGILNSLAVFFDTFHNEEDESNNSLSICTHGGKREMRWPPPRLGVNWEPEISWRDGKEHEVRVSFQPPLLSVFVDERLTLRAPVDLGRMVGPDGMAYVGFTASTGNGYENHDIWDWRFESVESGLYSVDSTIQFARVECMPGKSLCTPAMASVEPVGEGRFHVLLPAHLPWSVLVALRDGAKFALEAVRGNACWDVGRALCGVPKVITRVENGRLSFAIEDENYRDNEGYVEFDVVIR